MAKMTLQGFEEYELKISRLAAAAKDYVIKKTVYEGADVVADAVKASIMSLPVIHGWGTENHPLPGGVTATQKEGLISGFGISPMRDDGGYVNVKLGFDGYNAQETEKYPTGQPNQLVARGTESGTSWKRPHPFVRPAVQKSKAAAIAKMKQTCDAAIAEIMD